MTSDSLSRLDKDVLHLIFQEMLPGRSLRELSLTCKWLREACSPVLFRKCSFRSILLDRSEVPEFIPPSSLWPYIQELEFFGFFSRRDLPKYKDEDYLYDDPDRILDPLRCLAAAKKLGQHAHDALTSMPCLRSVMMVIPIPDLYLDNPGIPWCVLAAILGAPGLRSITLGGPMCHANDRLPPDAESALISPLETFHYERLPNRSAPRYVPMERQVLNLVLNRVCGSLQRLILPSEPAPLRAFEKWDWPMLQEFSLCGERKKTSRPLVNILRRMPRLRTLSLVLAEPAGSLPPPIWPSSSATRCQLQDLEHLTVTHPNPDDELYAHLPTTLRRLSLPCWPRYYIHHCILKEYMTEAGVRWASPILTSSEILHILKRSETPQLTHLELEYRADDDDAKLWRHIGSSYPLLTALRIHRYRAHGELEVPVDAIARSLSLLRQLKLLMLHLDFTDLPDVTVCDDDRRAEVHTLPERTRQLAQSEATIAHAANVFAKTLSPSLECICILRPLRHQQNQWVTFNVVQHTSDGEARAEPFETSNLRARPHGYSIVYDDVTYDLALM
ncbi:hypothetical protein FKP32DRAFT_1587119 [Trametes sanguinea]|nr:hypothetical protein FKP32DRAFT_1587119 [Trametes sanguinea]